MCYVWRRLTEGRFETTLPFHDFPFWVGDTGHLGESRGPSPLEVWLLMARANGVTS